MTDFVDSKRFFVVIPAYNEETSIRDIVLRTIPYCSDIIVVDDGSTDGTAGQIEDLPITKLFNLKNCGKGASLALGIRTSFLAGADFVITLDADGQHRPEDIPNLLRASLSAPDGLIVGTRELTRQNCPLIRLIGNKVANFWVSWAAGVSLRDSQSGFRIYAKENISLINELTFHSGRFSFETEVLIEIAHRGFPVCHVAIPVIYNPVGRPSHFRPFRDLCSIIRVIAWKLIKTGLHPAGFFRAFLSPHFKVFSFPYLNALRPPRDNSTES